ncbi:unnamed protein product [Phytophthora fragariaefolia]|uniref:Unnamed protein product n=1 Tax=Phytophthora fragariaefolia TaxID=1490495 RepID=A0A9W6Y1E0_9STRA|nr:unnamed protein product [Phytophthora fragariaefolia]
MILNSTIRYSTHTWGLMDRLQGSALVPGSGGNISGIGALSCSSLMVGGIQVVPPPSYVIGITEGSAEASKALVLDSMLDVSGINALSATSLSGTLQTASQPNITSLCTLTSINTSGSLSMGGISISSSEISVLDGVSPGTAQASKALALNSSLNISGIGSLSATSLTGTLQTTAQPNITSVGTLASLTLSGGISGVTTISASGTINRGGIVNCNNSAYAASPLSGSLVVSGGIGIQKNIAIGGIASSSRLCLAFNISLGLLPTAIQAQRVGRALVITGGVGVGGQLSATSLSGTIQTAAQPNITSIGTLSSLTLSGGLSASTLTGTLQTASQPNLISVGALNSLTVAGGLSASTLAGTLQTAAQPNITSLGDLTNLNVCSGSTTGEVANISMPAQAAGYNREELKRQRRREDRVLP